MAFRQLLILSFEFLVKVRSLKLKIKNSKLLIAIGLLPLSFLVLSCTIGPGNFQSRHATDLGARSIRRITVLPPESKTVETKNIVASPLAPSSEAKSGEEEPNVILDRFLYATISALPIWQVVSDREVREVLGMVSRGGAAGRAKKLGELVYADAVISGRILRFRERVGEDWGVKSPASVSFILELWDAKRGDLIWSGQFDETQKPLSQNLFAIGEFTQRGARWLTAEELALEGVKKAISQLHQTLYRKTT